jgi:hypothetical protein
MVIPRRKRRAQQPRVIYEDEFGGTDDEQMISMTTADVNVVAPQRIDSDGSINSVEDHFLAVRDQVGVARFRTLVLVVGIARLHAHAHVCMIARTHV